MSYNTASDYIDWVSESEAVEVTESSPPDEARIQDALDKAYGEILATLSRRYDSEALQALDSRDMKGIERGIARWNLDQLIQPRDFVFEAYKLLVARLRRIADGKEDLPIPERNTSVRAKGRVVWGNSTDDDLAPYQGF
jgi:phage gp36-like protein